MVPIFFLKSESKMKKYLFMAASAGLLLSACAETSSSPDASTDPITQAISGKTLVNSAFEFTAGSNGSFIGKTPGGTEFKGAWTVRDGQFCRTLTEPASFVGTECQDAELGDGTITISGRNGPAIYTIQ